MIRLRNEGPLQPPPRLSGHAEEVSTELRLWPDMISATHWMRGNSTKVDGVEFHVREGGELGHIHLNGLLKNTEAQEIDKAFEDPSASAAEIRDLLRTLVVQEDSRSLV